MWSSCIVVEIVFGLVVVFENMGEFVLLLVLFLFNVWILRLLLCGVVGFRRRRGHGL